MLRVGLTGGIGSGKTLICDVFKCLGIPVYNADERAKQLYDTNKKLKLAITEMFGHDLYDNGKLNRSLLASIIFNDRDALKKVNDLVHPAVLNDFIEWAGKQTLAPYVIQEAAILFESGVSRIMDKNISVSAPVNLRIKRASQRDNVPTDVIKNRMDKQMTDIARNKLADFVINNNGSQPLLPQILSIHYQLTI